jgi:hypothetical protein
MLRADPQHLRIALWAVLVLARHTATVWHDRLAFGTYTLPTASHRVFSFAFGHLHSPEALSLSQVQDLI